MGLPSVIPCRGSCKDHECLHLRADFCFTSSVSQASLLAAFHKTETSPDTSGLAFMIFAERGGFEPPIPFRGILAFQASQFNHSCISPKTAQFTKFFIAATGSTQFAAMQSGWCSLWFSSFRRTAAWQDMLTLFLPPDRCQAVSSSSSPLPRW